MGPVDYATLCRRYAAAADSRDPSAVAALFRPEGVLVVRDRPTGPSRERVHRGRLDIALAIEPLRALAWCRHAVLGTAEADEGGVHRAHGLASHAYETPAGPRLEVLGVTYEDLLDRVEDALLLVRRVMTVTWRTDLPR